MPEPDEVFGDRVLAKPSDTETTECVTTRLWLFEVGQDRMQRAPQDLRLRELSIRSSGKQESRLPLANEVLEHGRNHGVKINLTLTVVGLQVIVDLAPPSLLTDFDRGAVWGQCVLSLLRKRQPEVAWRLMIAILPGGYDTASPSPRPRWRDFSALHPEVITHGLIGKGAVAIAESLLEDVKLSAKRWKELFEVFPNLPPESRRQAVDLLLEAAPTLGDRASRLEIWQALRALLHHHRGFPQAQWALPGDQLEGIERAYAAITPGGIVDRIAWLFDKPGADLPVPAPNDW
jgi:hypothetical protein